MALFAVGFNPISTKLFCQQEKRVTVVVPLSDSVKPEDATIIDQARVKRNWQKLKKGMSAKRVETLLGKPWRKEWSTIDNSVTWYYIRRTVILDSIKQTVRYWEIQN